MGWTDKWTKWQAHRNNIQNHTRAFMADIHNSALSFIVNRKYEQQMQNITKVNIPTLD